MNGPIYVVVANDSLIPRYRKAGHIPVPIVFETEVVGASLAAARKRAAELDGHYGGCRIGRVVFDDEEGNPL